ncbi:MAG: pirin family protein [Pseudomonadota bacterium]|nr:pirin family protein [Pseudomonadota bacterium]
MTIFPRTGDIGNFEVHRALPFKDKRMVGPFIFWDQMGPGEFITGQGVDVRPHPHIGLSTLTFLFEGTMDHKDSLGTDMRISAGDLNLMTAGNGIVHSERTGQDIRQQPSSLYGIQSWIAQPKSSEQGAPSFVHFPKNDLPTFEENGVSGRVVLGNFHGLKSPVETEWDTLYVELKMGTGTSISLDAGTEERALYLLKGEISIGGVLYPKGQMMVLRAGDVVTVKATQDIHMMLLGGAAMDGPRHIWWNFVASDKELMEEAKRRWKAKEFPEVPNDCEEFIPLPE